MIEKMKNSTKTMHSSVKFFMLMIFCMLILLFITFSAIIVNNIYANSGTRIFYLACLLAIIMVAGLMAVAFVMRRYAVNTYRRCFASILVSSKLTDVLVRPDRINIQFTEQNTTKWYEIKFLEHVIDTRFKTNLDVPIMHISNGELKKVSIPFNEETEWYGYEIKGGW